MRGTQGLRKNFSSSRKITQTQRPRSASTSAKTTPSISLSLRLTRHFSKASLAYLPTLLSKLLHSQSDGNNVFKTTRNRWRPLVACGLQHYLCILFLIYLVKAALREVLPFASFLALWAIFLPPEAITTYLVSYHSCSWRGSGGEVGSARHYYMLSNGSHESLRMPLTWGPYLLAHRL